MIEPVAKAAAARPAKGTVLIVDDDVEVIRSFSSWLRLDGYEVRSAHDGRGALAQLDGSDAVVLDLHMPIVDGLQFLRQVRTAHKRVPIAIVTGDYLIDESVLEELVQLNAQVVFKPVWVDELVALAAEMVAERART